MTGAAPEWIGWMATAVFLSSYFCGRAESLKGVQMVAAVLWLAYGVFIHALPVVASNVLVIAVAAWTIARPPRRRDVPTA